MHVEIPAAFWQDLRAEGLVPPEAPLPARKPAPEPECVTRKI
jgi:D-threo-aldose 1-dehydrogenase